MPDSFFEVHIVVTLDTGPYFIEGPLRCGPYLSYVEAALVMMEGLHISLAMFWTDLAKHTQVKVTSKIVEFALIEDGKIEKLTVKSEETRTLSCDSTVDNEVSNDR
jgi:hypothetical protein